LFRDRRPLLQAIGAGFDFKVTFQIL
jgi:hypothetical protein